MMTESATVPNPNSPSPKPLERSAAAQVAEQYYDSVDADEFYYAVWGGEDIHIGLYETADEDIAVASRRTVMQLASLLGDVPKRARVADFGAGYGGAARFLARQHGLQVTALNLSSVQNERNRRLNEQQGLAGLIDVVHANFESVPLVSGSCDIVWSQDAILHSSRRDCVLREARRVLKPGGTLIFTDPMQSDDCPDGVLQPVYDRIHLSSLGSFAFYRQAAQEAGFRELRCLDLTPQLSRHYARVLDELERRYDQIVGLASKDYLDRMLAGLENWVQAGRAGYLAWGILHFQAI